MSENDSVVKLHHVNFRDLLIAGAGVQDALLAADAIATHAEGCLTLHLVQHNHPWRVIAAVMVGVEGKLALGLERELWMSTARVTFVRFHFDARVSCYREISTR